MPGHSQIVTPEIATGYLQRNRALLDALEIDAADAVALTAVPLKQGEHNDNFTFEHPRTHAKHVLRVNYASQMALDDQIGYEYRALECLQPSGRSPRPRYLDSSKQLHGHGVLVMDFCEGAHLDYGIPSNVVEAAAMLADVHAVPVESDCPLQRPGDPLHSQFGACVAFFENYRRSALADDQVVKAIDRMKRMVERVLETPFDPADSAHIQNTEAVALHFLIPDDGSPGHMVDWEKPIVGEVAQDVAYFLSPTTTIWDSDFIFSAPERMAFLDTYWNQVAGRFPQGRFEQRFDAYVKSNCLLGITWSANAWVEYHDPDRPLKNAKTFEKLKQYLSQDFLDQCFDICFGHPAFQA